MLTEIQYQSLKVCATTFVFTDEDTTDIPLPQQIRHVDIGSLIVDKEIVSNRLSETKNGVPDPDKIT